MHPFDINLCNYSDIFGRPKEGVHSHRIFGLATIDVLGTIGGGYLLSRWMGISFIVSTIILFIIGIILHYLFCVDTTINITLFGRHKSDKLGKLNE
jgi:hypothetical protein